MQGQDFHVEHFDQRDSERLLVPISLELDELAIVAGVPQMARTIMEPAQLALDFALPVQVLPLRHRCLHQDSQLLRGGSQTTDGSR